VIAKEEILGGYNKSLKIIDKFRANNISNIPKIYFRLIHGHFDGEPCSCGFALPESLMGEKICANLAVTWHSSKLEETSPGSKEWKAHMEPPPDGKWIAFFVDLQYKKSDEQLPKGLGWPFNNQHFEFTTSVSIVPNTYPYPECHAASCFGQLV